MRACIIVFSPSGNTRGVGEEIKKSLERRSVSVDLIEIAGDRNYFSQHNKAEYLRDKVKPHDVLLVGGPVYAHHLQYRVKELINYLPEPDETWGKYGVSFVTYGGLNSGIALEESGRLMKKRSRLVMGGLKVSMPHFMSRAFMPEGVNKDPDGEKISEEVEKLTEVITALKNGVEDSSDCLKYRSRKEFLMDNIIFREKSWHKKRYPKIQIGSQCTLCRKCLKNCPVGHLECDGKSITKSERFDCIHCLKCVVECPAGAVSLLGDLERARQFMQNVVDHGMEQPGTLLLTNNGK